MGSERQFCRHNPPAIPASARSASLRCCPLPPALTLVDTTARNGMPWDHALSAGCYAGRWEPLTAGRPRGWPLSQSAGLPGPDGSDHARRLGHGRAGPRAVPGTAGDPRGPLRRSTLIASQLPVADWHESLGDPAIADAVLDRLVHNARTITLRGVRAEKQQAIASRRENRYNRLARRTCSGDQVNDPASLLRSDRDQ